MKDRLLLLIANSVRVRRYYINKFNVEFVVYEDRVAVYMDKALYKIVDKDMAAAEVVLFGLWQNPLLSWLL